MVIRVNVKVRNRSGLHARPAAVFVKTCRQFRSSIKVVKGGKQADAKNILQVLALGVDLGDEIVLEISGDDENEAYKTLIELLERELPEMDK